MIRRLETLTFEASLIAAASLLVPTAATKINAAPESAVSVHIGNFTFNRPMITVKLGTTVTWTNGDDIPHTVVSKEGVFKSRVLDTGDSFSFTFAKTGQFGYFCSIHPHMTGMVIVKA